MFSLVKSQFPLVKWKLFFPDSDEEDHRKTDKNYTSQYAVVKQGNNDHTHIFRKFTRINVLGRFTYSNDPH